MADNDAPLTVDEKRELVREVAAVDGAVFLDVAGDSMEPLAGVGDRLGIVPATAADLKVGDVMAYDENDRTVCHRFLGWEIRGGRPQARQKGDNISAGSLIDADRIFGRVALLEARGRLVDLDGRCARFLSAIVGRYLALFKLDGTGSATRRRLQRLVSSPADRLIRRCGGPGESTERAR